MKTTSQSQRRATRVRAIRRFATSVTVPVVLAAAALMTAAPVSAATLPTGGGDPSFCADYGQTSNGSYAGQKACNGPNIGAIKFLGAGGAVITSDTVGFQCVELVTRYMYSLKGWAVKFADGAEIARVYGGAHGLAPVLSGNSAGLTPHAGDVISFSVTSNFTSGGTYPGHVAIVTGVTATSVTILSENWGGHSAYATLAMNGTRIAAITTANSAGTMVNTPYIEWLPLSGATPPPPPPPPPASYGPFTVVGTGSNGLNERSAPTTAAALVGHQVNGAQVYLLCQVLGGTYATGGTPATEAIWDKLTNGTYVADYWLTTPAVGTFSPGIPRC